MPISMPSTRLFQNLIQQKSFYLCILFKSDCNPLNSIAINVNLNSINLNKQTWDRISGHIRGQVKRYEKIANLAYDQEVALLYIG